MSYYNTTSETGIDLVASRKKGGTQDQLILNHFCLSDKPLSPSMILGRMNLGCPITSIRRSLTSLTDSGKLIKTDKYTMGSYGKREHLWRLKTEDDFINPDQFTLFAAR